ncbi:N-acetylmuramoyl-L-alanine amidase [Streptomyces sp. NPDC004327]|uniref:N-acetylmuramoyl-L-alanine amidase n=1 Tax=unclassified Streptomyces TaxID=2593676 RepID=UPI0036BC2C7F
MRRRRIWGTAAAVAAGLSGILVFQGVTGNPSGSLDDEGGSGPVRTEARSLGLKTDASGHSASLAQQDTKPFSMLGVTWSDPSAKITGSVEARARKAGTDTWGRWVHLDGNTAPEDKAAKRGGTDPAWVGASDGVEVRVVAGGKATAKLPAGLRVDMIDPGRSKTSSIDTAAYVMSGAAGAETTDPTPSDTPTSTDPGSGTTTEPTPGQTTDPAPTDTATASPSDTATTPTDPATTDPATTSPAPTDSASATASATPTVSVPPAPPSTVPQPVIKSRTEWGADESISPEAPSYLPGPVKAVAVHHTADSNTYTCADGPAIVRGIYTYHVKSNGWKDIGYNFLVDKCGVIYEGRKGGVDRPVFGAHTYGFNSETAGISVLGDYNTATPSTAALTSVARLAAWKLGQYGVDPTGTTTLTAGAAGPSGTGRNWAAQDKLTFPTIFGHRDGYNTECPGNNLYAQLGTLRSWAGGPVAGLTVKSVSGAGAAGGKYYTRGPVTVNWSATTPSSLIAKNELLVDGKVAATVAGTATSASATVTAGAHSVQVRATHQSGKAATSAGVTVVGDTTAPVFTTKPTAELTAGTVNTTSAPVLLRWKATDTPALRDVRLTTPAVTYGPATTVSGVLAAKPAVATTWTLSAYDQAGNKGTAAVAATPVILQETSAVKAGTWTARSSTSYLAGKSYSSGTKNASLTWTFTGRSAAWVVSRSTTSGQAYVYVDNVKVATVDLKSATTLYRNAIWTKTWATSAKHTVKIVVVGTAGRPTVTTDGLVYLK